MGVTFQRHHAAMLLKYSGISFIAGAVNHGFFSGERSLWTAAIGMVLFVIGAVMEHQMSDSQEQGQAQSLMRALIIGALLSIGLGFFTGGLQHFPDSPARSAWVVPLGFFISVIAFAFDTSHRWKTGSLVYSAALGILVTAGSYGAWRWLEQNPDLLGVHAHGHHGEQSGNTSLTALKVDRTLEIQMDDKFRFTPGSVAVSAGETVKLVVRNIGKMPHELVLGSEVEIQNHAKLMKTGVAHDEHHASGAAITVAPGTTGELVIRFAASGSFEMACLIPGHYEAGMRGVVKVAMASGSAQKPAHDHSSHKH
ncbi:MAG: hypothetical protein EBU74_06695 [Betaproteobacteria bacterium]|nr:hypothetical protein [Betaproteobacteria bacterium]